MGKVDTGEVISGIYKITNKINGKYYIGQSIDINFRWYSHNINAGKAHNSAIDAAIQKYGVENFEYEILEVCDQSELFVKERYWAEEIFGGDCYAPKGYNICRTGVGRRRTFIISQYDLEGNKIETYLSCVEAARVFNVSKVAIRQSLNSNCRTCCGYMWRTGCEEKVQPLKKNKKGIGIDCYDESGQLVMSFDNGKEAAEYFGITTAAISSYVTHKFGYVKCSGYYLAKNGESPIIRKRNKAHYSRPCHMYDPNTKKYIKTFESIKKATIECDSFDSKSIRNALNGVQNFACGYIWSRNLYDVIPDNYREINKSIYENK